ncbi:hypothetical protein ACVWXM_000918 [Bradyrhizobium sp. GM7.3]
MSMLTVSEGAIAKVRSEQTQVALTSAIVTLLAAIVD